MTGSVSAPEPANPRAERRDAAGGWGAGGEGLTRRQALVAGAGSLMGWSFDLFDLFILLFVAPTIAKQLFPTSSATLSLALVYVSFTVSLLMRPLGGGVFGRLADRRGRRGTLLTAYTGAGLSTALMGLVPTFAQAAYAGPVLFLVLRLVQGLFVGGVVASTHTLGTESAPERWRGFMSGLVGGAGAALGAVLASVLLLAVSAAFPGKAFDRWGWRVMFLSALVVTAIAAAVFVRLQESPLWEALRPPAAEPDSRPAAVGTLVSRRYGRIVAGSLVVVFGAGAQYYLTSGYLPTILAKINHVGASDRAVILIWDSLVILLSATLVGEASQRWGRRRVMVGTGAFNLVALPVLAWVLTGLRAGQEGEIIAVSMALAFCANAAYAPVLIFLNERFPTAVRATGTALTWNIGFAAGGLMTTFVSLASPSFAALPSRLVWFLIGVTALFTIAAALAPETKGALLREHDTDKEMAGAVN